MPTSSSIIPDVRFSSTTEVIKFLNALSAGLRIQGALTDNDLPMIEKSIGAITTIVSDGQPSMLIALYTLTIALLIQFMAFEEQLKLAAGATPGKDH